MAKGIAVIPLPAPPLDVNPAGIPDSLKALPRRWVGWKLKPRLGGKKPAKVPVNPATKRAASHSDPETWDSFDMALRLYRDEGLGGVGFMFAGDGLAGVDLDDCRCPDSGALDSWAEEIVSELGTYAEVSPSGSGVKLIARGQLDPMGRNRHGAVEMYDRSRFFAITGHRLTDAPSVVVACQEALTSLQERLAAKSRHRPATPTILTGNGIIGTDEDLLDTAFGARNGGVVFALWNGDLFHHPSYSEALLALAQYLAFYSGPDEERLERLIVGSPLFVRSEGERQKWQDRRPGGTWGTVCVIRKAILTCQRFYSGHYKVANNTYTGAEPTGATTAPSETQSGLDRCGHQAERQNVLDLARAMLKKGEIPPSAMRLDHRLRELAALCYHLAALRGGRFFLGEKTAERITGIRSRTAARRLKKLVELGVIRVVRKGRYYPLARMGFATQYEWIGEEAQIPETAPKSR